MCPTDHPQSSQTPDIDRLAHVIREAWDRDTSAFRDWTPENPAHGQCAVTALVIQDYLGGSLLRADIGGISHYWNAVEDCELDLTRDQFNVFEPRDIEVRTRDYVLSCSDTVKRYRRLAERVRRAETVV